MNARLQEEILISVVEKKKKKKKKSKKTKIEETSLEKIVKDKIK